MLIMLKNKVVSSNIKRKCTKMVYEPGGSCDHNMEADEGEVSGQISRLLPDEREKGGTIQDGSEGGQKYGGLCGKTPV